MSHQLDLELPSRGRGQERLEEAQNQNSGPPELVAFEHTADDSQVASELDQATSLIEDNDDTPGFEPDSDLQLNETQAAYLIAGRGVTGLIDVSFDELKVDTLFSKIK